MVSKNTIPVIELCGVGFRYGEDDILSAISGAIRTGQLIALIGPNGSGKTTLLRLMLGLLRPTVGEVKLLGRSVSSYSPLERARRIAYVAQQPVLSFPLTVEDLVRLGRFPHGDRSVFSVQDATAVAAALAKTDSAGLAMRPFNVLSGGEKQKVLIARALAQTTQILLLDEPTLHLDLFFQLQVLRTLKQLCVDQQTTVVTVLHDMNLVMQFADSALLLKNGKCLAFGAVSEVINETAIRDLLGVELETIHDEDSERRYFIPRVK